MRLLYIPEITGSSISHNVGYMEFCHLVDSIDEPVFWYVILPSGLSDGIKGFNNVQYIYLDFVRGISGIDFSMIDIARYFSRKGGKFVIDGVLTNCSRFSAYLFSILSDVTSVMPVVVRDHRIEVRDYDIDQDTAITCKDNNYRNIIGVSDIVVCKNTFGSIYEKDRLIAFSGRYLKPSIMRTVTDGLINWPIGFETNYNKRSIDGNRPVLFCGGSYNITHREELGIIRQVSSIVDCDVVLATVSPKYKVERSLPGKDKSFIKTLLIGLSNREYDLEVPNGNVFVSINGGSYYCREEIGRLFKGQIGAFYFQGFPSEILGDKYPFYYETSDECIAIVSYILENLEDSYARLYDWISSCGSSIDIDNTVKIGWKNIRGLFVNESKNMVSDSLREVIVNVSSKMKDSVNLDVFLDLLEEHAPYLKPWNRKGTLTTYGSVATGLPTLYDVKRVMEDIGWVDSCDSTNIVMKRREKE